jgi:hypothetical protein
MNKSFLSSGKDLKLSDNIFVKHPTIQEIYDISDGTESTRIYWSMVYTLTCDPYDNMVMLDDMGIDYEETDCFNVFLYYWNESLKEYEKQKALYDTLKVKPLDRIMKSLTFFLGKHNFQLSDVNFGDKTDLALIDSDRVKDGVCDYIIDRNMFNLMSDFLFAINNVDKSQRIKPATKGAKKVLIEDMRDEIRRKKNEKEDDDDIKELDNYIGHMGISLSFGGNGGVTIFNYKQLKIYELIMGYKITLKKSHSDQLKNGIYSGNIDASKISKSDLDWSE